MLSLDFNPAFFTFAGEMLDAQPSGPTQGTRVKVRGNCFACHARDAEDVKQKMRLTSYYKEVRLSIAFIVFLLTRAVIKDIWDISTAQISPLETVHTSNFGLSK